MKKRITSLLLALIMLLQVTLPQNIFAEGDNKSLPQSKTVKMGEINAKSYGAKMMLELNRLAARERKQKTSNKGAQLFSGGPYFGDDNEPKDEDKPKYHGNVKAKLTVKGLNDGDFQWNEIFGVDNQGNPKPAQIVFTQINDETGVETGVERYLKITKVGTYAWTGGDGDPAELPLFNDNLDPFFYEVRIDEDVSEKVQLLTATLFGSEDASPTFEKPDAEGRIKFNLVLDLTLQQITSTKFTSEWFTGLDEEDRPQIQAGAKFSGIYMGKEKTKNLTIDLPRNDTDEVIVRDLEDSGNPNLVIAERLNNKAQVEIKKDTQDLTFEEADGVKTVKSGDHKFKYDFNYDVINGGKLIMTEILPVTFNANGGKFDSITGEGADQKIVKEVDYSKDLTDKVEIPKKDLESFKGWATEANGKPLSEEDFKAVIKNIKKAKTFYAIWDNNAIQAKKLEVFESFKDGTGYVNDFIPTLADLKKQVTIADANGDPKALADDDTLQILDDSGNPIADKDLKDKLYEKLKEDPATEVSRLVTLKARVTHKNKSSQPVEIPIKVIKNIYEAKTEEGKPNYVPEKYVKVTVDPTTKAEKPQKYFYYVNPEAKVVIPGTDPTGAGDNTFVKWIIKESSEEYKLAEKQRHKFTGETTIEAQYESDVIPKTGTEKPDTVPGNFVEVKFVPTDKATDTAEKIFWVNPTKKVTIPVNNPVGKQYYTFKEWKIGDVETGETYTVGTAKKFETATTITATYTESKDIIPYNPKEPTTRPDGYVRVTFEAEEGLTLSNDKAYYVKKGANITLGNPELIKPTTEAKTGYEFKEWDKKDNTVIGNDDVVVTAKPEKLPTVVPEKDGNGTNEKPNGYKVVTFVIKDDDKTKGSIDGVAKFYVNPTEYVTINPPTTKANTGYEFGAWDQNTKIPTVYKDDTTITASFNGFSDVIPKTKNNDSEKPKGYVTVTFEIQATELGSKFLDGETTVYYVNPNKEVTLNIPAYKPAVGYQYLSISRDPKKSQRYEKDTVITIYLINRAGVIPSTDDQGNPNSKPDGYITVTFDKGEHGKEITGQTVYYVNPKANPAKTLGNERIIKPTVKAETGWKQKEGKLAWDTPDTTYITGTRDITVTARYEPLDDIIPKTTNDDSEKPEGYVKVKFIAGKNGKLIDSGKEITEKVYYVNPNKYVKLTAPTDLAKGNTGYVFSTWDRDISNYNKFTDKVTTITANFVAKDAVVPKTKDDDSEKPAGFVTVKFEVDPQSTGQGSLEGITTYFVDPNQDVTLSPPKTNPNIGYEFEKWDQDTTKAKRYGQDTTVKATFKKLDDVIPGDKAQPKGYLTVTFVADSNGSLSGTTKYYVKPNTKVDLSNKAENAITKTANLGYTEKGGTWTNQEGKKLQDTFSKDAEFVFNFVELGDVIPAEGNVDQPKGYVKVEFIAGENGRLEGGNKTYYVNPTKGIKVGSKDLPIPQTTPKNNYKFDKWLENIDQNEVITTDKKYVATFKINKVTMTYKADDKTSGDVPKALSYDVGTKITLAGGVNLKKENYVLVAWSIGNKSYLPGAQYTITENTTATAVWDTDIHTVEFDTDGAGHIPSQKVKHNESIGPVTDPVKDNYTFTGWKVDGQDFDPATAKVEKDITLVAQYVPNVVEQTNGVKPQVPEDFVKVTVDTTDKATDQTKFERTFWVKKDTPVTLTVPNPTGDTVKDADGKPVTDVSGKEVKWNFTGWSSPLTASFAQETIITAKYDKTIPEPNIQADTVTTYVGKQPGLEDYKNALKAKLGEDGIDFATNVKETTVVTKPDVSKPGMSKARVQIEFNNGTTKTVEVPVKVNPNMYPADTDGGRTTETPANYVKVIVNPTILNADPQIKIYYVNPEAAVAIPLPTINPQDGASFIKWYIDEGGKPAYNGEERRFTAYTTMIVAKYDKAPIADYVLTEEGVQPKPEDYKKAITPPDDKEIGSLVIIDKPDVSKPGMKTARIQVNYTDGTNAQIPVRVFVQRKPQTDWQTGTLGPTRTRTVTVVEKEIVKVPAEKTFRKEVRYMQGYNNYFRPGAGLTRAEAAQILANALVEDGYRYDPNFAIHYKDIVGNEWYAKAIRITSQANVFKGYDTGYFDPHKKITRAEWIGTLRRFQELERVSGNHMQVRTDHWAMGEIEAAYKEGWLAIYGQGLAKFKADEFIPRQEVAAVSNKAFNRVLDKTYIHRNSKNLINYKDVNPSLWSYEDILCASNGFIHDGKSFWGHKVDYKKDLYNINLDGYTVTKDKFQRLERR